MPQYTFLFRFILQTIKTATSSPYSISWVWLGSPLPFTFSFCDRLFTFSSTIILTNQILHPQVWWRCYSAASAKRTTPTTICRRTHATEPSNCSSCSTSWRRTSSSPTSGFPCSPSRNTTSIRGSLSLDSYPFKYYIEIKRNTLI